MTVKKTDLINKLVEEYGYEKADLKFDAEGKPYTNAKLQALINAEIADAMELEADAHRVVAKAENAYKDHDLIQVMSGSTGGVIYRSDVSRRVWKFQAFGQMENMPYGELVAIHNRYPKYFDYGWLVVLDKKVQEEFGLTQMYKNILTPDNIESIFTKTAEELEPLVDNLPDGMKTAFLNKAHELYHADRLTDTRILRLIEKKFHFSIVDNSPIDDVAVSSPDGFKAQQIFYIDKK